MVNNYKKILFLFIVISLTAGPVWAGNMEAVSSGLDVYAREKGLSLRNISSVKRSMAASSSKPIGVKHHDLEVGIERYRYVYQEMSDGRKFMNTKGFYNAFLLTYTFRPDNVAVISDAMSTVFRAELRYALGKVDYTGSGTYSGLDDHMYELRGIIGQEIGRAVSGQILPYVGIAMRYLNNGLEEYQPGGYNRESTYFYVPIGVQMRKGFSKGWNLGLNLEYDYFCSGEQTSHLEDTGFPIDPSTNKQRKGFGWRGSLKIVKEWPRIKLSIEPYYRYWHIRDSEISLWTSGGVPIPDPYNPGYFLAGQEPDNTTQETGVKMGIEF